MCKVLIVGVRKQHANMLKDLYSDLKMDFLTDNRKHTPVSNREAYDKIISLTKFTNHSMHKSFRSHSGYIMISGGFSNLRKTLDAL